MTTPSTADNAGAAGDGTEPDGVPEPQRTTPVVPMYHVPDPNLASLDHVAYLIGFPVTLYLPWGLATGHTCAQSEFYKHLAERARAGSASASEG